MSFSNLTNQKNKEPGIIIDLSFPHNYTIIPDLNGPYNGDSEIRLTHRSGHDYYRYLVVSGKTWILAPQYGGGHLGAILATPEPQTFCVISVGNAFLLHIANSELSKTSINPFPTVDFVVLPDNDVLLLTGHSGITAVGKSGKVTWNCAKLAFDGIEITKVEGNFLEGMASGVPPNMHPFRLDLRDGEYTGGFSDKSKPTVL
jgi:hypothetical protein